MDGVVDEWVINKEKRGKRLRDSINRGGGVFMMG
jgi:hypothetical protein